MDDMDIWYPDASFVELVTAELVPILFREYDGVSPDFQYLGGEQGLSKLESALARPKPIFGHEKFPTIAGKAAALIWAITKNHPFNDGNKRAALVTGFGFLFLNRYFVCANQDEAVKMCLGVADSNIGYEEAYVARWIDKRIVPFSTILNQTASSELRYVLKGIEKEQLLAWIDFYMTFVASVIKGEENN